MKVLSSTSYQLQIPRSWKIHPVFHASLLTLYKENDIHGPNFPEPPPDLINEEEEYEIEWILKHQGSNLRPLAKNDPPPKFTLDGSSCPVHTIQ